MRALKFAILALASSLLAIACSARPPEGTADDRLGKLVLAPSGVSVPRGRSVPIAVSLERRSNNNPVVVTANGLPDGVSAAPLTITGDTGMLVVSASASAAVAEGVAVTVVAASGSGTSSALLAVSVIDAGFSLALTPATISIGAGSSRAVSVTVSRRGLPDPISVAVSGLPPGVTADGLEISGNRGSLVLRVASTVPLEAFDLTVRGLAGSASASAPLTLLVVEPTALDVTFGASGSIPGVVISKLDSSDGGTTSSAAAAAIQADGKIVVVGSRTRPPPPACSSSTCWGIAIARYNPDGTLDPTFVGDAGVPDAPPPGAVVLLETALINRTTANGVAISDAGVLVAATGPSDTLLRLTADGALDTSFNADGGRPGRAARTIAGRMVAVMPDEKILVAGQTVSAPISFALARYNPDGALDQTFGVGGILSGPFVGATGPSANGAVFTGDQKVKVVGTATVGGRSAVAVMAFNASGAGSIDESFNGTGQLLIQLGPSSSQGKAALDVLGSTVVVARTLDSTNHSDVALAAFQPDGGLDRSFGEGGTTLAGFVPDAGVPNAAAASSQKIAVAGTFNNTRILLMRYKLDGSLDDTFGPGGSGVVIDVPAISGSKEVNGVTFQPDGKIVLVGSLQAGPRGQFAVVRYAR